MVEVLNPQPGEKKFLDPAVSCHNNDTGKQSSKYKGFRASTKV